MADFSDIDAEIKMLMRSKSTVSVDLPNKSALDWKIEKKLDTSGVCLKAVNLSLLYLMCNIDKVDIILWRYMVTLTRCLQEVRRVRGARL